MSIDKNRYIILVRGYDSYDYNSTLLIESVGEWDIVTQEEYEILHSMQNTYDFRIIERNPVNRSGDLRTPKDYIALYRETQKKAAERRAARAAKEKKTTEERKRKQLEKLKRELGEA